LSQGTTPQQTGAISHSLRFWRKHRGWGGASASLVMP
jgi:hypothetical protein